MFEPIVKTADAVKERRLEQLREDAAREGRVLAPGVRPVGSPFPAPNALPAPSAATGYYGLALLKEPTWIWTIPVYFFAGGAAGGAGVISTVARWTKERELARDARWLAVIGAAASAPLLIFDLGRPSRFLHMLRVFKWRSPMSVGVWTLMTFSAVNTGALATEYLDDWAERRHYRLLRALIAFDRNVAESLSALSALVMCTYTGVLIGVTTVPVWARSVRLLPAHFGASGVASAVAILELAGHDSEGLRRLGIGTSLVETLAGAVIEASPNRAVDPLKRGPSGWLTRIGGFLSGPVPLALRLFGGRSLTARRMAATSTIIGSVLTRFAWIEAGRASAQNPRIPLELEQ